jgi:signal transduction histidine kinase
MVCPTFGLPPITYHPQPNLVCQVAVMHRRPNLASRSLIFTLLRICSGLAVLCIPVAIIIGRPPEQILIIVVATLICLATTVAYWLRIEHARYLIIIALTLAGGLLLPEPYVSERFAIVTLMPPIMALLFAGAGWIVGSAVAINLLLIIRAGWQGIYLDPIILVVWTMIISGIYLARIVTDRALRQAAEQAQLLEEERLHLAERVAERTLELSVMNTELLRAHQIKDAFLATVSHELRTPLNVILGNTELLEEQVYGTLNSGQQRAVRAIGAGGDQLLRLIEELLDLSQLQAGSIELHPERLPIADLCAECLRQIGPAAQQKQLTTLLDLDPQLEYIWADQRRLRRILLNLLTNAVKFTPPGKQIGLRVQADAAAQLLRFIVWDEGIGISPEQQARLFEPFVQIDDSFARQYAGLGLGLALAQQLAALQGSSITIESTLGQGAAFILTMPWVGGR